MDTWWQTETGAIMITTLPGLIAAKPGSAGLPLPGVSAALVEESGGEIEQGGGLVALTRPWPGMLRTLYEDPDRYVQTYFGRFGPRTYFAGDGARRDEDGYFWITGRVDDVINVSLILVLAGTVNGSSGLDKAAGIVVFAFAAVGACIVSSVALDRASGWARWQAGCSG